MKREDKKAILAKIGLKNNPCQGCGAYYPDNPPATFCSLEAHSDCEWIRLYDEAIRSIDA